MRSVVRPATLVGSTFIGAGFLHFLVPEPYIAIMPRSFPAHRELVYASGVAEMAGGAGLLFERTRRRAGVWLALTLLGIFPANVNMAVNAERFARFPRWALWARLPLQGVMIAWVLRVSDGPAQRPAPRRLRRGAGT